MAISLTLISVEDCAPCKDMKEMVKQLSGVHNCLATLKHVEYSIDEFALLSSQGRLPVRIVPALLAHEGDYLIGRIVGMKSKGGPVTLDCISNWVTKLEAKLSRSHHASRVS